jgi:hypothetical protein
VPEFRAFGADFQARMPVSFERAREIRSLLAGGITPPPVQDRLPMWLGYRGPPGAYHAGLLDEGLLRTDEKLLAPYRAGLTAGGHDPSSARMAGGVGLMLADDPEASSASGRTCRTCGIPSIATRSRERSGRFPAR